MNLRIDHKQLSMIAWLEIYHRMKFCNHTSRMIGALHVPFDARNLRESHISQVSL